MVITSYEQYKQLLERMNRDECILTPIFRDPYYHRVENSILCVAVTFMTEDTYILSISHDDAPMFDVPSGNKVYSDNDINILAYVNNQPLIHKELPPYATSTQNQFGMFRDTNKLIPLTVWGKVLREYNVKLLQLLRRYHQTIDTPAYTFTKELSEVLQDIEVSGLTVDKTQLRLHYDTKVERYFKTNKVFSEYNIFTTTGRPSNRFGGINFSALNKSDGSRETFISRYTNGVLVQFDFEAYHLRLIADEYNITLPQGSLHTELAKIYFNTDTITDDLYMASKQKTFEIMYGMSDETYGIPLFEHIVKLRKVNTLNNGMMTLPSGMTICMQQPNPSKAFNYYVQSLEIVKTLPKLRRVLTLLKDTPHRLILYTYDSILLDMQMFDQELVQVVTEILEEHGKFPVRIYVGENYNNITEIRL